MPLYNLDDTKARYREAFSAIKTALLDKLDTLQAEAAACTQCLSLHNKLTALNTPVLHPLLLPSHPNCLWDEARRKALNYLELDLGQAIVGELASIKAKRDEVSCGQTGACCRLASSQFSWQELCQKAAAGDDFAQQFTSVFLPYASTEAARLAFATVVDEVLAYASHQASSQPTAKNQSGQAVYFYHCPYIGANNACTLYGTPKRPAICQSYPETPLGFIHKHCAWRPWQQTHHKQTLHLHATVEQARFLSGLLKEALLAEAEET